MALTKSRVFVSEMAKDDLPFLIELWHNTEVMRYADELPWLRGWSKSDDLQTAWQRYQAMRVQHGAGYVQWVIHLKDGTPIGESFFCPLPEGDTFGKWHKPDGVRCLMGDLKLLPEHWGQGLGTEGMRQVAQLLFTNTNCQLLVVPPHRHNPAASRVYEKAGFVLFAGMRSWRNHKIMELTKERFETIYGV
jgi:RimJ/RimL family protein N-acetyltransferase